MHRVLCVDDSRTFRELLEVALGVEPDIEPVGYAFDVEGAVRFLTHTSADVVLMDYDMPGADGIEGVRRIKHSFPGTRVIVLTGYAALDVLVRAASAGADGFLAKDSPLRELVDAIRNPSDGLELGSGAMAAVRERVGDRGRLDGRRWDPRLTERERDVLGLLAEGLDPQSIARHLGITVHTSRGYVRNVLGKLGAHSQLEAVITAARAGIITGLCDCCNDDDGQSTGRSDIAARVS